MGKAIFINKRTLGAMVQDELKGAEKLIVWIWNTCRGLPAGLEDKRFVLYPTDVAKEFGVCRQTVYTYIKTLVKYNYIEPTGTRSIYRILPKLNFYWDEE